MNKQLTDLGYDPASGFGITRYALWELVSGTWQIVDTGRELDALARRNGIDKVQVVEITKGQSSE